jgi:hypothetical protein
VSKKTLVNITDLARYYILALLQTSDVPIRQSIVPFLGSSQKPGTDGRIKSRSISPKEYTHEVIRTVLFLINAAVLRQRTPYAVIQEVRAEY